MVDKKRILVVDDENTIREVMRRYLEREGFDVIEAADGYTAMDAVKNEEPDLVLMDLMLPGIDGLTITRHFRQSPSKKTIPIIMLTAKGEISDRIRGLDFGADDYISKPFSPREVISRIHAVLRRSGQDIFASGDALTFEGLTIEPAARTAKSGDKNIQLSVKEFDLLYYLASHPRQVFSRDQLLEKIWGHDYFGDPSTVTVHIRRLREKIEPEPSQPIYVKTVWGVGYKFDMDA